MSAPKVPAKDRSNNPYRRFFSQDRSAADLRPAKRLSECLEPVKENYMDTSCVDFRHALNICLVSQSEGYVKVDMEVLPGYLNPIGSIHGGLLYTLADSACGAAVLTYGNKATTLTGNIDYLKPGLGCKKLTAEATVIKHGRTVSVADCRITDETGTLLATARMTFYDLGQKATYTPADKYRRP